MEKKERPTKHDLAVLRQEAMMKVYEGLDESSRMLIDYQADRLIKGLDEICKQKGRQNLARLGEVGALELLCCLGMWLGKEDKLG